MKKRIWIIALAALIITLLKIVDTYGLFETNAVAGPEFEIGKWKIYVNNRDISTEKAITLSDFQYSQTSHVEDGYFAPGRNATFDVEIDTSQSDVSVEYDLTIDDSSIEEYPNIYFSIMNLNTNEEINSNSYSGIVNLNDTTKQVTLRITIIWENDSRYDESDTALIGKDLQFVINANFKQYIGE